MDTISFRHIFVMGVFAVAVASTVCCTTLVVPLTASDSALTHEADV